MSPQDLQFINRALAHPWMFWVYFWKWPRLVRQACAEYAMLARERDDAKAAWEQLVKERDTTKIAYERSVKENKTLLNWVHVTHRLSTTPDGIRALFAAGKRLSILLLFLSVALPVKAQLPPILRQYFTTNAHVLSNGAGALTNNGSGTLGWLDLASFASASSAIWTNDGTAVMIHADTNRARFLATRSIFGSNNWPIIITNGAITGGEFVNASGSYGVVKRGGVGLAGFDSSTNCFVDASDGSWAGGNFFRAVGSSAKASTGGSAGGDFGFSTNAVSHSLVGGMTGGEFSSSRDSLMRAQDGGIAHGNLEGATNSLIYSWAGVSIGESRFTSNGVLLSLNGMASGIIHGVNPIIWSSNASLAIGSAFDGERLFAESNAVVFGRNSTATNNVVYGHNYTNAVIHSFAVGFNGTTAFRAYSNGTLTIRNIDYVWPAAHAAGALTNDGSGGLGWTSLSSLQTPWLSDINAAAFSLTNFGSQLVFTNGSKIGATATNTLTLTNSHLLFSADNVWDIGGPNGASTLRPRNVTAANEIKAGDHLSSSGYIELGTSGDIRFQGRSRIFAPDDGHLKLANTANANFGLIQFGGTTAAEPGLGKTNGHLILMDATRAVSTNGLIFGFLGGQFLFDNDDWAALLGVGVERRWKPWLGTFLEIGMHKELTGNERPASAIAKVGVRVPF